MEEEMKPCRAKVVGQGKYLKPLETNKAIVDDLRTAIGKASKNNDDIFVERRVKGNDGFHTVRLTVTAPYKTAPYKVTNRILNYDYDLSD